MSLQQGRCSRQGRAQRIDREQRIWRGLCPGRRPGLSCLHVRCLQCQAVTVGSFLAEVPSRAQYGPDPRVRFLPTPVQTPRIPIWVAGIWPHKKPFRRAAQFNGVYPQQHGRALTPEDYREILAFIQTQRTHTTPFEALAYGRTSGTDQAGDAAHAARQRSAR